MDLEPAIRINETDEPITPSQREYLSDVGEHAMALERECVTLRADLAAAQARAERMQAAIERYLELDSDCEYVDGTPDVCPGIDIMGGPCQWCALRAALEDGR